MKIYKISVSDYDYDEYDAVVVSAENEKIAMMISPYGHEDSEKSYWASKDDVTIEYIGETEEPRGVILASFNAG